MGEKYWVFTFLFAKSSKENIEDDELKSFKDLANLYAKKNDDAIQKELDAKELLEICNEEKIQK